MTIVYEAVRKKFQRARALSDAMHQLDCFTNPEMKHRINRLTFIKKLDEEIASKIPIDVQMGAPINEEGDPLFLHPEDPLVEIVENFIERYIDSPWSDEINVHAMLLKIVVYGLSSPALGVLAPRGVGKSVALSLIVVMWAFFNAKGEDMFIVAPTTNQTDKVYQYVVDWFEFSKGSMLKNGDPAIGYKGVESIKFGQKPTIKLRQGTLIRPACASRNNRGEAMRGQQPTFELIDECSYISDDIYYRTLKAGMGSVRGDHDNVIIESGTPDAKNHFYDLFYDKKKFGHYNILRFDYEDGLKCNRYTKERINQLMLEAGGYDSEEFKSEYRCIFPESITSFFRNVDRCFSNQMVETAPMPGMHYVAGLDLGRVNDSTVLTVGRYSVDDDVDRVDVVHIMEIHPNEEMEYPDQYQMICDELANWNVQTCYVDYTGPGIPIFESLKALASQRGIPTTLMQFSFQSATKYPAFVKMRSLMQYHPLPRIRYPDLDWNANESHPDYNSFVKAESEFKDIIQKRTNSSSEASKYKIEPSKSRAHDDFVASAICLTQCITDTLNSESSVIGIEKTQDRSSSRARGIKRISHRSSRKPLNSRSNHKNYWRQM